jgi:hypothetical protein
MCSYHAISTGTHDEQQQEPMSCICFPRHDYHAYVSGVDRNIEWADYICYACWGDIMFRHYVPLGVILRWAKKKTQKNGLDTMGKS